LGCYLEKRPKIFDYDLRKFVTFTQTIATEAREHPHMWLGSIEEGRKNALPIFSNRVCDVITMLSTLTTLLPQNSKTKCLSCSAGGRGNSMSKKGKGMKGIGLDYLSDCGCPVDTALIELFTVKSTAGMDGVAVPDSDNEVARRDFSFNPVNLTLVRAVIKKVSGHNTNTLFAPEYTRLTGTVIWAMKEIESGYLGPKRRDKLHQMIEEFKKLIMEDFNCGKGKGKGKAEEADNSDSEDGED
jgi:hypothetical protein